MHMFDVMLIREFGVEEINAQVVSKAFVDGARMVGIMDERNVVADIDQLAAQQTPRRELASTELPQNLFRAPSTPGTTSPTDQASYGSTGIKEDTAFVPTAASTKAFDAVSSLFGLDTEELDAEDDPDYTTPGASVGSTSYSGGPQQVFGPPTEAPLPPAPDSTKPQTGPAPGAAQPVRGAEVMAGYVAQQRSEGYFLHISGPGIDTQLNIQDVDDLQIASILLEKIRKQLTR
ncbi:hypothetical protein E5K00_03950 [Hymenobacter aquaticus]|uniref:Uncharacterized protein n=1 Tax=Hymenobacter aquaticus TaxID=1867101 RepID=A0A4Z0Q4G4_9BACT|nr:hypothetical protein [Hymenobacter aquaticus]TGE24379.1 hypothetical protein E5K00_03950 [Hymenobacter aquaticus]